LTLGSLNILQDKTQYIIIYDINIIYISRPTAEKAIYFNILYQCITAGNVIYYNILNVIYASAVIGLYWFNIILHQYITAENAKYYNILNQYITAETYYYINIGFFALNFTQFRI